METGYIKLFRKIDEWEWYSDGNTFRLFLELLLRANYKSSKYRGYDVPRGSVIFGRKEFAKKLKMSEREIRTSLSHLKSTSEVTTKSTNRFTIVCICQYESYQGERPAERPASRPTTDQQPTTSKEGKKEKNIYSIGFEELWLIKARDKDNKFGAYKAYNKALKEEDHTVILEAYKNHKASWITEKRENNYIPMISSWLNDRSWEDETVVKKKESPYEDFDVIMAKREEGCTV